MENKAFKHSFSTRGEAAYEKLEYGKKSILAFLTTRNEAGYLKYSIYNRGDHATHRQFLVFTLAVNFQTKAKENAHMKMKLVSRGSALFSVLLFVCFFAIT